MSLYPTSNGRSAQNGQPSNGVFVPDQLGRARATSAAYAGPGAPRCEAPRCTYGSVRSEVGAGFPSGWAEAVPGRPCQGSNLGPRSARGLAVQEVPPSMFSAWPSQLRSPLQEQGVPPSTSSVWLHPPSPPAQSAAYTGDAMPYSTPSVPAQQGVPLSIFSANLRAPSIAAADECPTRIPSCFSNVSTIS